jgi:glycosyltransferase involved in cell wall biosynthesis
VPKTILFDNQIFDNQEFGGISRYFTELITGINNDENYLALPKSFYSKNSYLVNAELTELNWFRNSKPFRGKARIEKSLRNILNERIIKRLKNNIFDVFHPTYYDPYFTNYISERKPFVLTVHDMIHEQYYDHLYNRSHTETLNKAILLPKAAHIIAVSQFTKDSILSFYPEIDPNRISVIYHGSRLGLTDIKFTQLPERYLLFVGLRKHYKNFQWLTNSLNDTLKENKLILLCAGGPPFDYEEQQTINNLGLREYVYHKKINTENELASIYKNAICLIFPSLIEGFGLPIIEAFGCRCPVLASNTGSLPEIAGDAALMFESKNDVDLKNKINQLINDESLRKALIQKGSSRSLEFTWDSSIKGHLKVYNSVMNT